MIYRIHKYVNAVKYSSYYHNTEAGQKEDSAFSPYKIAYTLQASKVTFRCQNWDSFDTKEAARLSHDHFTMAPEVELLLTFQKII